jgi:hypothetical protein
MAVHKSVVLTSLDLRSVKTTHPTSRLAILHTLPSLTYPPQLTRCTELTACALRAPRRRRRFRARPLRRPRQRAAVSSERPTSVRHATNLYASYTFSMSAFRLRLLAPASRVSEGICLSCPAESGAAGYATVDMHSDRSRHTALNYQWYLETVLT